jgi:hypothetical protein
LNIARCWPTWGAFELEMNECEARGDFVNLCRWWELAFGSDVGKWPAFPKGIAAKWSAADPQTGELAQVGLSTKQCLYSEWDIKNLLGVRKGGHYDLRQELQMMCPWEVNCNEEVRGSFGMRGRSCL